MHNSDLRDLELAGVRWEISDQCITTPPAPAVATVDTHRTPTMVVPPIAPTAGASVDTAVAAAARPTDIATLRRMIGEFMHPLRAGATNVVLPMGPVNAEIAIITDVPGTDDDATGRVMSGAAGETLGKMLSAIGISRDDVCVLPLVFWRTPGGRGATRDEMDLARPFVDRTIELTRPRVVITLGTCAAAEFAGAKIPADHGKTIVRDGYTIVPIYHPNYLILKPAAKRDAWDALQTVQKLLKSVNN